MLIAVTILQLLSALILILIVLFQSGKSEGLSGAIGGIVDSYMSKSPGHQVGGCRFRGADAGAELHDCSRRVSPTIFMRLKKQTAQRSAFYLLSLSRRVSAALRAGVSPYCKNSAAVLLSSIGVRSRMIIWQS